MVYYGNNLPPPGAPEWWTMKDYELKKKVGALDMNDNSGDFKDYPKSVGEVKSDKTNKASDISPRELLVQILRDIDKGELSPIAMVICMALPCDTHDTKTSFAVSSKSPYITISMLEIAKTQIVSGGE